MPPNDKPSLAMIRMEIQRLRGEFKNSSSPHTGRIDKVLAEFEEFTKNYKSLWEQLLGKISRNSQNSKTTELVDDRIIELWLALQEIVRQYQEPMYRSKVEEGMRYLENLCQANPAFFPSSQANPDVLIFIEEEKANNINIARRYPYTNTFFIGISEFSVNLRNAPETQVDWRPVAHELGHYIYWNSCFVSPAGNKSIAQFYEDPLFSEEIEKALETIPGVSFSDESMKMALIALMISWSEEIFADLVGTSLLGRDYVISAQEVFTEQRGSSRGIRFMQDIDHPIPYLRPYVCAEGLKLVEGGRNMFWSKFREVVKGLFDSAFEDTQKLVVGWFSEDSKEYGFKDYSFDVPTMQSAIKLVVPVIYDQLKTKEPLTGQPTGIDLIKERMEAAFVGSYVDISEELERGDGPGLFRWFRRGTRRLITSIIRR